MKKVIIRSLVLILLAALVYGVYYGWQAAPIITAYSAKNTCSCIFLSNRTLEDVRKNELASFPLRLGSVKVDKGSRTVTSNVFGLAERKAIYRERLGCTIVSEIEEDELRNQTATPPPPPAHHQDTIAWPAGNLTDGVRPPVDAEKIKAVLDEAFSEPTADKKRRTRAVVVVYDGNIIAERYADGIDATTKLTGWSMAKSITNALVGVLVKQGKLSLEEAAPINGWQLDSRKAITLNHLMQASSGLEWTEVYSGPSSATNMLFKKRDAGLYAAESRLVHQPGVDFYYSSGTTNIISRIIRNTVGDSAYYAFPYQEVFYKIGMYNTVLEPDAGGTFVGSSFAFAPARDWARFGLLYLNDGLWNGERILPEGWVEYTTTPAPAAERGEYGAQFWLNAGAPGNESNRYFPELPTDLFWADGYEGQNVFILPSKKLVAVKLSLSTGDYLDDTAFLKGIIEALPEKME